MSSNKNVYFQVTTTKIVSAKNKADATAIANRKRGVDGTVLATDIDVDRISAEFARDFAETAQA